MNIISYLFIGLLFLFAPRPVDCKPLKPQLLNSERIAYQFGTYGISVLNQSPFSSAEDTYLVRLSNLYSEHEGKKICRTFAVTFFASSPLPLLEREHELIVYQNQSIGAVFKAAGWEVKKRNIYIGKYEGKSTTIRSFMDIDNQRDLALHVYQLSLCNDDVCLDYAVIGEIPHPDYLSIENICDLYGQNESFSILAPKVQSLLSHLQNVIGERLENL